MRHLVALLSLFFFLPTLLLADGVDVDKWLTLQEVVAQSKTIVVGEVVQVAHIKKTKKAYGENRTYISDYRLKIKITEVLQGDASLKGKTAWFKQYNPGIPGKTAHIQEDYISGYSLDRAKKKDSLLLFFDSKRESLLDNGKTAYVLEQQEKSDKKAEVQTLIATPGSQPATKPSNNPL